MTGPRYNDERMQELAEDNAWLRAKLRAAETANAEYALRMEWSPAKWDQELRRALDAKTAEYNERAKLERELTATKKALEDALHDAKRWRKIAEEATHKGCEVTTGE